MNLFDHIKQIREVQNPNYFNELSETDKKSWTNYMILQVLSMDTDLIEIIDYIQRFQTTLSPESLYRCLIDIIPKGRRYCKYITGKKEKNVNPDLMQLLRNHYEFCSDKEIVDYIQILKKSDPEEIPEICAKYGKTEKETKALMKGIYGK